MVYTHICTCVQCFGNEYALQVKKVKARACLHYVADEGD